MISSTRDKNPITIIGYWLKPETVTGVAGWPKSSTSFDNWLTDYLITDSYLLVLSYLDR